MNYPKNPVDWLLLHSIPRIGPATLNKLLERFGEPQNVFGATRQELMNIPGLSKNLIDSIVGAFPLFNKIKIPTPERIKMIKKVEDELKQRQFRMITHYDKEYPLSFKTIKNSPPIIYVYGNLNINKSIAIIGARLASRKGLQRAFKFAYTLVKAGFTIVSGYAKGIDTQAHLGAIKGGGYTIMVLPTGALKFIVHKELYGVRDELLSRGIILSEFFPLAGWTVGQAMMRNRLISELSDAVLVIEAGTKGGTISTAKWAKKYGKPLFICQSVYTKRGKEILKMGGISIKKPEEVIKSLA